MDVKIKNECLKYLSKLIDDMEQVVIDKLADQTDVNYPNNLRYEM